MLTVATYNIYLGADLSLVFGAESPEDFQRQARLVHQQLRSTDFLARAEAIAGLLVRERVDLVGLQEVATWSRVRLGPDGARGEPEVWCDFLVELLAALERAGSPYDAHAPNENFHGGATISDVEAVAVSGSNVILVRRGSGISVVGSATGTFAHVLDILTGMVDVVLPISRSWGWVDAVADGFTFRFVNTHTEAYDEATRNAQRDELLHEIGDPGMPVVVVGDFNATPDKVGMPEDYQDAWVIAGAVAGSVGGSVGAGYTCGQAADLANPESLLTQRIDYVFVRDAAIGSCRVVGDAVGDRTRDAGLWPSDHACVVCTLQPRGRPGL